MPPLCFCGAADFPLIIFLVFTCFATSTSFNAHLNRQQRQQQISTDLVGQEHQLASSVTVALFARGPTGAAYSDYGGGGGGASASGARRQHSDLTAGPPPPAQVQVAQQWNQQQVVAGHSRQIGQGGEFVDTQDECRCELPLLAGSGLSQGNDDEDADLEAAAAAAAELAEECERALCGTAVTSAEQRRQSGTTLPSSYAAAGAPPVVLAPETAVLPQPPQPGPPAKPSGPVEVSFLLYTRLHLDLARRKLAAQLAKSSAAPSSPAPQQAATTAAAATTNASGAPSIVDSLVQLGDVIELGNETTLAESKLNSSLDVKIIVHGFGSGGRRPWVADMVYKLLEFENVNVIVADWERGAAMPNYVQAAGNTRQVGHKIARLIKMLNSRYGLTGKSYHLIGFSLGAHVAGFAGMELNGIGGGGPASQPNQSSVATLARITGLDPASPLFEGYGPQERLDPSDAQFVDVIHSNGDGVLRGGFGSLQPMGHVDFYPNGGRVQVGCNSVLLAALSDIIYGKWQSLCNHRRALNFFMDSFELAKCRFRSFNCDSYESFLRGDCFDCGSKNERCSYMGYRANLLPLARGKMYLTTHQEAPFCANQFMFKIIGTKGYKPHWGKVEVTLLSADGKNESFWLSSIQNVGATSGANAASSSAAPLPQVGAQTSPSPSHELSLASNSRELVQQSMQSLIVAHPSLSSFVQVVLRYTKYKGWIYSGDESWPIDKVFITDSDGQVKSFCGSNTILESQITTRLNLELGNCSLAEAAPGPAAPTAGSQQLIAQQQQQQQQLSTTTQPQQAHEQQRTPRLLASILQSASGETGEAPSGGHLSINQHVSLFQRVAPQSQAQQQQFVIAAKAQRQLQVPQQQPPPPHTQIQIF